MNREKLSESLSGIRWDIVDQCQTYSPPGKKMPPEKEKKMISMRKAIVIAIAACLLLGLTLTAYAAGAFDSLIAKWENHYILPQPDGELWESNPEYAERLEERWKMRDEINHIGEKSLKETQVKEIEGLPGTTLTLLESYYDGQWIVAALRLDVPNLETRVILDKSDPGLDALQETSHPARDQFWELYISDEAQRAIIRQKVENNEPVGFYGQNVFIGDGTWINDERCFLPSSEPDADGVFIISPYQDVPEEIGLPESAIDQVSVDMMLKVKRYSGYFWIENGTVYAGQGTVDVYPTHFTLKNING